MLVFAAPFLHGGRFTSSNENAGIAGEMHCRTNPSWTGERGSLQHILLGYQGGQYDLTTLVPKSSANAFHQVAPGIKRMAVTSGDPHPCMARPCLLPSRRLLRMAMGRNFSGQKVAPVAQLLSATIPLVALAYLTMRSSNGMSNSSSEQCFTAKTVQS